MVPLQQVVVLAVQVQHLLFLVRQQLMLVVAVAVAKVGTPAVLAGLVVAVLVVVLQTEHLVR